MADTAAPTRAKKGTTLIRFFGKRQGDSLADAVAELKALTDQDVDDLFAGIDNGSYTY